MVGFMKILRMLKTLVTAEGLKVLLLGKEVALPGDVSLGVVVDIKKELVQDRLWMVIDNLGQRNIVPIEQITRVANEIILIDDILSTGLAANKG